MTPIATVPLYPDPCVSAVPIPTAVITPFWFLTAVTAAPTNGANPRPFVDPRETITPPLGNWFWLTSSFDNIKLLLLSVIPVNVTLVIPVAPSIKL